MINVKTIQHAKTSITSILCMLHHLPLEGLAALVALQLSRVHDIPLQTPPPGLAYSLLQTAAVTLKQHSHTGCTYQVASVRSGRLQTVGFCSRQSVHRCACNKCKLLPLHHRLLRSQATASSRLCQHAWQQRQPSDMYPLWQT